MTIEEMLPVELPGTNPINHLLGCRIPDLINTNFQCYFHNPCMLTKTLTTGLQTTMGAPKINMTEDHGLQ